MMTYEELITELAAQADAIRGIRENITAQLRYNSDVTASLGAIAKTLKTHRRNQEKLAEAIRELQDDDDDDAWKRGFDNDDDTDDS